MTMRDLAHDLGLTPAISAITVSDNTAQVGAIIDMKGFSSIMFAINVGLVADAAGVFTVLLEDGDDSGLSDAAAVDDSFLIETEADASWTQATQSTARKLGYIGYKRYLRVTVTPTTNAAACTFAVTAVKGHPRNAPVA